jgi:hypothetical protein
MVFAFLVITAIIEETLEVKGEALLLDILQTHAAEIVSQLKRQTSVEDINTTERLGMLSIYSDFIKQWLRLSPKNEELRGCTRGLLHSVAESLASATNSGWEKTIEDAQARIIQGRMRQELIFESMRCIYALSSSLDTGDTV